MNLAIPKIHVDGTSREELLRLNEEAQHALWQAINALTLAAPNGCDYIGVTPAGTLLEAKDQHNERLKRLQSVYAECQQMGLAIADQA